MLNILHIQSYQWSYWSLPPLLASIYFFSLGVFILIHNVKSRVNIAFSIISISCFVWLFSYSVCFSVREAPDAYFWSKNAYFGINFIAVATYHFAVELVGKVKQRKWVNLFYALMIAFVPVTRTHLFLGGVIKYFWGYYPYRTNFIYDVFILSFCFYWSLANFNLFRVYRKEQSRIKRQQLKLVLIAMLVVTLAFVDFVGKYKLEVYPWGYVPVIVFLSIMFYAIVRYHLMEIDTVIHRTIMWVLTLLLVVLPVSGLVVLSRGWFMQLNWEGLLILLSILLVTFVGYYNMLKPRIDRVFRRRKYDYYQVLGEVGQRIGSELDIDKIVRRLSKELRDVLYVRNSLVLIQQPDSPDYLEAGSSGYENLPDSRKTERVVLKYQDSLSQWITEHRVALERIRLEVDPSYEPVKREALAWFEQNELEVLIPVVTEEKVVGLVGIGKKENLQVYTRKDVELLEDMGRQIGVTIENALHHEDLVEKERLAEEMRLGRHIQMSLLPQKSPEVPGMVVRGLMHPAKEIGGDYYDFIIKDMEAGTSSLGVVIGDVSGKGVAAGLIMTMAKTAIQSVLKESVTPRDVLLKTHEILYGNIKGEAFMTMLYFDWDASSKKLRYSSAGHEHIIVYRKNAPQDARLEVIKSGGVILGMVPEIDSYLENKELSLEQGDKVVLYTDGVTEARDEKEDFFGLERLAEVVERCADKEADELLVHIMNELFSFMGSREQYDDITLVVMEAK